MISRPAVGAAGFRFSWPMSRRARAQALPSRGGPMPGAAARRQRPDRGRSNNSCHSPGAWQGQHFSSAAAPEWRQCAASGSGCRPATIAGRTTTAGDRGEAKHPRGTGHRTRRDRRCALFSEDERQLSIYRDREVRPSPLRRQREIRPRRQQYHRKSRRAGNWSKRGHHDRSHHIRGDPRTAASGANRPASAVMRLSALPAAATGRPATSPRRRCKSRCRPG